VDTLNSSAFAQDGPTSESANSPDARQDGAGDQAQKRVDDLMGLANRRLSMAQRAEAERDAARAEVEALRASIEDGWADERARYWQSPGPDIAQAAPVEGEATGVDAPDADGYVDPDYDPDTDFTPRSQPKVDHNAAPRSATVPIGARGSDLDLARAAFTKASEQEDQRIKALLEWP
jgi:hypothetical protein